MASKTGSLLRFLPLTRAKTSIIFLILLSWIGINNIYRRTHRIAINFSGEKHGKPKSISIIAYGDSLTNGLTPGTDKLFPYAPHLESVLQAKYPDYEVTIHQGGISGWSSKKLLRDADHGEGIRTLIRSVQHTNPLMAILLAGTNDLKNNTSVEIGLSVKTLHEFVLNQSIPETIAIGIPPMGPVIYDKVLEQKINITNEKIHEFCDQDKRMNFVPFPFWFSPEDDRWSSDTIHLTPKGYRVVGEMLAPAVNQVLERMLDDN